MTCMECGKEITTARGTGHEVIGIEVSREQGGTNHIYRRRQTGREMCSSCVIEMKHGITKDQLTLA